VLREHYAALFRGDFPRGVYPDEWHWREGISKPDAFREIVNGWKASHLVARVALSERIGRLAAELMGWSAGARLGQDDLLWKPAGAGGVAFHTDAAYISSNFRPYEDNSVTVWIALDDADAETGVVAYAPGSHAWPSAADKEKASVTDAAFHGEGDAGLREPARRAAAAAGVAPPQFEELTVPAGGAVFHHQDVWHGSGPNVSPERPRRALGLHYVRADAGFREAPPPDYIYGRYVLGEGDTTVHETFFPIVYTPKGYRSPVCDIACADPRSDP